MKMMGGQSLKNTSGGGDVSLSPLPSNVDSHYAAPLSSYDVRVHEQTNRALDSLATRIEVGSVWSDELMEPTDVLLQMNEDIVKIILETKRDDWSNKELFSLVDAYFDNIFRTLDFYAALENNLRRTRDSQFIIKLAINRFESAENGAAMSAPPLVAAVAAALAAVSAVGKLCGMLWNLYLNSFEREKQLLSSMRFHSFTILEKFKNIRLLVHALSIQLRLFLQNANLGIKEQGGVMQHAVDEIKKNLEGFDETIEKLSVHAAKCSTDVTKSRTVILQEIIRAS